MSQKAEIAHLIRRAMTDMEPILARIVAALRTEVPGYGSNEGFSDDDIRTVLSSYINDVFQELCGTAGEPSDVVEALMWQRANAGITQTDMLHSYRVGIALLWDSLAQLAADSAQAKDALIAATPAIFAVLDRYSLLANRIHHEIALRSARRSEQVRASLLDLVLSGASAGGPDYWNAVATLRIPRSGAFLVVELVPLQTMTADVDPPELEVPTRALPCIESAWFRVLPRAQIGLIALNREVPHDFGALLEPILASTANAAGISTPFSAISDAGKARTQAHVASSAATPGRPVVRYDGDLLPVLLASAPDAAGVLIDRTLDPVLQLAQPLRDDLLETVRTWLANRQSVVATAAAMHCHRNTVNYRLRRFEEVSGRSFSDNAWTAQLVLALEAWDQRQLHADAGAARPAAR